MQDKTQLKENVVRGIFWSAMASTLWAFSGILMQMVAKNGAIPVDWFISARTSVAGVLLLIIGAFHVKKDVFKVFKDKRSIMLLLIYSLFGLAVNMSTFYMAIQTGNAPTATLLQYLAPIFIVLYKFVFRGHRPLKSDVLVFFIALVGIVLSVTKGDLNELSIPLVSILWGLGSAVSAAIYYSVPQPLSRENSPFVVLGWGTLIASIPFNIFYIAVHHAPFFIAAPKQVTASPMVLVGLGGVILVGTIGAFSSMIYSLKFASSEVLSIVDAVEPAMTFILSLLCTIIPIALIQSLGVPFDLVECIGAALVIYSIYLLQKIHRRHVEDLPPME
ncbi:DMT family transporter [Lactobacillus sp. Sy-1]|uniref:DMT family transporter n=1 Tax=Lactobacillus sp. Sy-1 TaxID=2109645 RepID=UPI001C567A29|nr:DMT family transporter [Lactobacillus sp. Sy-1]MBW1605186.1 DMT family transporter [Lactobacillus sp. Sy-1]